MLTSAKNTIVVHPSLNMYQDRQKNVCFITFSPFNLFPKNVFFSEGEAEGYQISRKSFREFTI